MEINIQATFQTGFFYKNKKTKLKIEIWKMT